MNKKIALSVLMATGMACAGSAQGQQTVQVNVDLTHAVPIPDNVPTEVARVTVGPGTWDVSGQINYYEGQAFLTVFVGAEFWRGPNPQMIQDGFSLFTCAQLERPTNINLGLALPTRSVYIAPGDPGTIKLMAWSHSPHQPPPSCIAWGFIRAQSE